MDAELNADVGSGRETPPGFHMETLEARGLLTKANLHGKMRMESVFSLAQGADE